MEFMYIRAMLMMTGFVVAITAFEVNEKRKKNPKGYWAEVELLVGVNVFISVILGVVTFLSYMANEYSLSGVA